MTEVKQEIYYGKIKLNYTYEDGVKHGKAWGEVDGKVVAQLFYKNGEKDGIATAWDTSGIIIEQGLYIGGEKEGLWKEWNDDGTLRKTIEYRDGKRHGDYKIYFPDGNVTHYKYDDGHRVSYRKYVPYGIFYHYYLFDIVSKIKKTISDIRVFIQKNKKRKKIRYHTNGNISTIENWLFNKKNGLAQRYYYEGQLWETIHFRNDKANGEYKMWSEDGKLIKHCSFRNDNVIKEWI